jgi:hypothetical protein
MVVLTSYCFIYIRKGSVPIGIKTILYEAAKYNVVGVWRKANFCGFEAGYIHECLRRRN